MVNEYCVKPKQLSIGYESAETLWYMLPNKLSEEGKDQLDLEKDDIEDGPDKSHLGKWHIACNGIGDNGSSSGCSTADLMKEGDWCTINDASYATPQGSIIELNSDSNHEQVWSLDNCDEMVPIVDAMEAYKVSKWSNQMGELFAAVNPLFKQAFIAEKFAWQANFDDAGMIDDYVAAVGAAMEAIDSDTVQNGAMMLLNVIAPKDMTFDNIKASMDEFVEAMPDQGQFANLVLAIKKLNEADEHYLKTGALTAQSININKNEWINEDIKGWINENIKTRLADAEAALLESDAKSKMVDPGNLYGPQQKKVFKAYKKNLEDLKIKIVVLQKGITGEEETAKALAEFAQQALNKHLTNLQKSVDEGTGTFFSWLRKTYTNGVLEMKCDTDKYCEDFKNNPGKTTAAVKNDCTNAAEVLAELPTCTYICSAETFCDAYKTGEHKTKRAMKKAVNKNCINADEVLEELKGCKRDDKKKKNCNLDAMCKKQTKRTTKYSKNKIANMCKNSTDVYEHLKKKECAPKGESNKTCTVSNYCAKYKVNVKKTENEIKNKCGGSASKLIKKLKNNKNCCIPQVPPALFKKMNRSEKDKYKAANKCK